jgi:hypothetical protein
VQGISIDRANALCGLIFIGFGAFFGIQSLGMEVGTAIRMGPGFFPLILAGVLVLLGLLIVIRAARVKGEPIGPVAWRGALLILPAPIVLGLTVRGLGFVGAIFVTALVASFASALMRPGRALLLALGITIFAVGVFSYGLGLPFRRFGPWLEFLGLS